MDFPGAHFSTTLVVALRACQGSCSHRLRDRLLIELADAIWSSLFQCELVMCSSILMWRYGRPCGRLWRGAARSTCCGAQVRYPIAPALPPSVCALHLCAFNTFVLPGCSLIRSDRAVHRRTHRHAISESVLHLSAVPHLLRETLPPRVSHR